MEEIRDGTYMPFGDAVIPIYLRTVTAGAATIDGMKPAVHTICAMFGDPRAVPNAMKFKCTQVKLTTAAKQTATLVVPADWYDSK
jgi:hypothetical protein